MTRNRPSPLLLFSLFVALLVGIWLAARGEGAGR